jgi:hypothetical protein
VAQETPRWWQKTKESGRRSDQKPACHRQSRLCRTAPPFLLRFSRFGLTSVLLPLLDLDTRQQPARAGSQAHRRYLSPLLYLCTFFFGMRQRLHTDSRLGLNTRRQGSIPHAPLPCLRLADCSCAFRPEMLASILRRRRTSSRVRSLSAVITDLALTSTSSACGPPARSRPHLSLSL